MLDLVVSIVNHNSVEPLRVCLRSIFADGLNINFQVYVVDNACESRAEPMLRKEFPQVKVIANSQTLGFGANHNQVLKRIITNSRYALILNPDTVIPDGTIQHMVEFMDLHPSVAICGPKLTNEHGMEKLPGRKALSLWKDAVLLGMYILGMPANVFDQVVSWWRRLQSPFRIATQAEVEGFLGASRQQVEAQFCEWLNGACMLARMETLSQIGLFDERFFLYFEERDLCVRARLRGWKIAYLPTVNVVHSGAYSTRQQYHRYLNVFAKSCLLFYHKHAGSVASWVLRLFILCVVVVNLLQWSVRYAFQPSSRRNASEWLAFSRQLLSVVYQPIRL